MYRHSLFNAKTTQPLFILFLLFAILVFTPGIGAVEVIRYIPHEIKSGDTITGILKKKGIKNYNSKSKISKMIELNPHAIKNKGRRLIPGRVVRIPMQWKDEKKSPRYVKRNVIDTPIDSEIVAVNEGGKSVAIDMSQSETTSPLKTGPVVVSPDIVEKDKTNALKAAGETAAATPLLNQNDSSTPLIEETLKIDSSEGKKKIPRSLPARKVVKNDYVEDQQILKSSSQLTTSTSSVYSPRETDRRASIETGINLTEIKVFLIEYPELLQLQSDAGFRIHGDFSWDWNKNWQSRIGYGYRQLKFKDKDQLAVQQESTDYFEYRFELSYMTSPNWRFSVYSETRQEVHAFYIEPKVLGLDRTWQNRAGGQVEFTTGLPGQLRFLAGAGGAMILPHSVAGKQLRAAALGSAQLGLVIPIDRSDLSISAGFQAYNQEGDISSQDTLSAQGQINWAQNF